jgi:hypothetical protein
MALTICTVKILDVRVYVCTSSPSQASVCFAPAWFLPWHHLVVMVLFLAVAGQSRSAGLHQRGTAWSQLAGRTPSQVPAAYPGCASVSATRIQGRLARSHRDALEAPSIKTAPDVGSSGGGRRSSDRRSNQVCPAVSHPGSSACSRRNGVRTCNPKFMARTAVSLQDARHACRPGARAPERHSPTKPSHTAAAAATVSHGQSAELRVSRRGLPEAGA